MVGLRRKGERNLAAFGHGAGVGDRLRNFAEQLLHLVRTLEIKFRRAETKTLWIVDRALGVDAKHHFVRLGVLLFQIMNVVGGDQRQIELLGIFDQLAVDALFLVHAVIHDFKIEVVAADKGGKFVDGALRAFFVAGQNVRRNLAADAGGEHNQPFVVFGQQFLVDARPVVIHAGGETFGNQVAQTVIAVVVLGQKDQVQSALMLDNLIFVES